jgi:hypothetical protein
MTPERLAEIREAVAKELDENRWNHVAPMADELLAVLDEVTRERDEKEAERDAWKDNAEQWARERDEARGEARGEARYASRALENIANARQP